MPNIYNKRIIVNYTIGFPNDSDSSLSPQVITRQNQTKKESPLPTEDGSGLRFTNNLGVKFPPKLVTLLQPLVEV